MTFSPLNSQTAYLPTSLVFSEQQDSLLITLTTMYTDVANYVNLREIAQFETVELLTGQQFFNPSNTQKPRQTYRKVFDIPAITQGVSFSVDHNITGITAFTHIYGTVTTNVVDYRPIPYASTSNVNDQMELKVTSNKIFIISGSAFPNVTSGIVVLEYLKD